MLKQKKIFSRKRFGCVALVLGLMSQVGAQTAGPNPWRIQALHAEAGKPSVYEIAFTTSAALTPEAEFTIEFPAEFDLSQLQIAGSPDLSGGFTISRDKQKVLVQRSGLGQTVASGTRVRLRLGAIINPKNFDSSSEVILQFRASPRETMTSFAKQRVTFEPAKQHEFKN